MGGPGVLRRRANGGATIIAPDWILTAKSVVRHGIPSDYTFTIGYVNEELGTPATAKEIIYHPNADLALVKLNLPVTNAESAPLGDSSAVAPGQTAQIYGWGRRAPKDSTPVPIRRC